MSLIQQYKHLRSSIEHIFSSPKEFVKQDFKVVHMLNCFGYGDEPLKMSQMNISKENVLFAFLQPPDKVLMLQIYVDKKISFVKCGNIYFSLFHLMERDNFDENYNVLDLKLYSTTILSVLLQENSSSKSTILYQVPLVSALDTFVELNSLDEEIFKDNSTIPKINGSDLAPKLFKCVEGMIAAEFAVSGSRKVGIVLSENKRKLRLYEMEGEEEEEEDADMTARESDMSVAEPSLNNTNIY